jgi:hypothetical protein
MTRPAKLVRLALWVGLAGLLSVEAWDEVATLRRRVGRLLTGWVSEVERRERRGEHWTEIATLASQIDRRRG